MKRKYWIIAIFVCFVLIRLPGLYLPYHQDEFKTAWALKSGGTLGGLHHPPLTQILYNLDGVIFGADHLRIMPFVFSIVSSVLLYFILKRIAGARSAIISVGLFAICAYSVLASLMIDTDGAILPTFFLLSVYLYKRLKNEEGKAKYKWLIWLILALVVGFMTKLSFVIAIGAILLDFIAEHKKVLTKKFIIKGALALAAFFGLSTVLIIIMHYVYPSFEINSMISHAASYAHIGGRNYFQSIIQGVKSVYYLSPLLLVPLLFIDKEVFNKMRIFYLYLTLGFIFYFVLFDFSSGALDKYLMFMIVPLVSISGMIFGKILDNGAPQRRGVITFSIILTFLLLGLNFLNPDVIGLYPKSEWFSRVGHLKWNMLNPFTGGDGPVGFYVSFLFIALSFLVSLVAGILGFVKKEWRQDMTIVILIIGLAYNAVFVEELLFGVINGNSTIVLANAISFIRDNPKIKKIISYNDIGAYDLSKMSKYENRFYALPGNEEAHKKRFSEFDGEYMIIDIPHLYQSGFYGEFFAKCHAIYTTSSGRIFGYVVSCPKTAN